AFITGEGCTDPTRGPGRRSNVGRAGPGRTSPQVCSGVSFRQGHLKILKPETVIRWHRSGSRAYWRWKSRPRGGRPAISADVRTAHGTASGSPPPRQETPVVAVGVRHAAQSGSAVRPETFPQDIKDVVDDRGRVGKGRVAHE